MRIIKHIPNSITCCNLLSGCISIVLSCSGRLEYAGIMIFIAAVFDFFDGFAARLLKAYSPLGAQLDSLSDVVSFGVAPSFIMYKYLTKLPLVDSSYMLRIAGINVLPFLALFLAVFAALRLAKFNIDERQTTSFIGLPTPAMGIFVASLPFTLRNESLAFMGGLLNSPLFLLAIVAIFSYLMISEIPFFSLKIKNLHIYVLAAFAVVAFVFLGLAAIPFVMLFYILLSLIKG
mgnify:CR=1 FL=1